MTVAWHPFDYDHKAETKPPKGEDAGLFWIMEQQEQGVTLGYWDGITWCHWTGSDDVDVSHWAPIEIPEPPTA